MDASESIEPAAGDGRQSLELAVESFRSYLLFVAWRLKGDRLAGKEGASDLVQRTILAAVEKIREGDIPGPTDEHRKDWLRKLLYKTFRKMIRHENTQKRGGVASRAAWKTRGPTPRRRPAARRSATSRSSSWPGRSRSSSPTSSNWSPGGTSRD